MEYFLWGNFFQRKKFPHTPSKKHSQKKSKGNFKKKDRRKKCIVQSYKITRRAAFREKRDLIKGKGIVCFNDALYCERPQKVVSDSQRRILLSNSHRVCAMFISSLRPPQWIICVSALQIPKNKLCAVSKIKNGFAYVDCVAVCLICTT